MRERCGCHQHEDQEEKSVELGFENLKVLTEKVASPFCSACSYDSYLVSLDESRGDYRSTESLTRCQASRVAFFARSQPSVDLPRAVSQPDERSASTSLKLRSG